MSADSVHFDRLIGAEQLAAALQAGRPLAIIDCSFDLADPDSGRRSYNAGHLPGARYVHLDQDLSAPKTGRNGRHPLPERAAFARRMASLGLDNDTQVVAYDNAAGIYAARLWWMLRWAGHRDAAVLDGGVAAWQAAGLSLEQAAVADAVPGNFAPRDPLVKLTELNDVRVNLSTSAHQVIDARAPDRFRGENETLDPVGGHIPGARNRFFRENLGADGRYKSAVDLRMAFEQLMAGRPATQVIHQCGSGVTACHNVLAMEVAGLSGAALYAGSWSEWCAQPGAPLATGDA